VPGETCQVCTAKGPLIVQLDDFGPFLRPTAPPTQGGAGIIPRKFRLCRRCLGPGLLMAKHLKMAYTVYSPARDGSLKILMKSATGHR